MPYYQVQDHNGVWLGKPGARLNYLLLPRAQRYAKSMATRRGKNPETRGGAVKIVRYENDGRCYDNGKVVEWFHH